MKGRNSLIWSGLFFVFILTNCNTNLNISSSSTISQASIGGVVAGLASGETVVLQDNGADNLTVTGSGSGSDSFVFTKKLSAGDSYSVKVLSSPALKTCIAGGNSGTINASNVGSVLVTCSGTTVYTAGGSITGLSGTGLVLQNTINLGASVDFFNPGSGAVSYTFPHVLNNGDSYNVTVITQPSNPSQTCTVAGAAGTVSGAAVSNINISCSTNTFTVGGVISGMAAGDSIVLNDGTNPVTVTAAVAGNQTLTFPALADTTAYNVTVTTQPAGKTCTITNGAGTLAGASVTDVFVTCTASGTFTVGGDVTTGISGLANNSTIVLNLTSTTGISEALPVTNTTGGPSVNLPYTFLNTFATGDSVTVTITNPASPSQNCTAGGSLGPVSVAGANIILPLITCATNTFTLSGNVSGLTAGTDNLTVTMTSATNGLANPVQNLAIAATAASMPFSFAPLADGSSYSIYVSAFSPSGTSCGAPLTGILSGASISTLAITCAAGPGVSVTVAAGINVTAGTGLGLELNGDAASDIFVTAPSTVTFTQPLLISGDLYSVSIIQQPDRANGNGVDQLCYLSVNSSGSLPALGAVVTATCTTVAYPVAGSITGLASGEQAVVYNNTAANGQIVSGGGTGTDPYTLSSINDGSGYTLSIIQSPPGKLCYFALNGLQTISGTVAGAAAAENVVCGPFPPDNISVASGNGQTTINWTTIAGLTYNIYWSTSPGVTVGGAGVTQIAGAVSPYIHTPLTNGTNYYYRISAVNAGIEGPLSMEYSALPMAPLAVSEGAAGPPIAPLVITLPHNGGITGGVSSYYQVNGLTPGSNYIVTINNISSDVNLDAYTDSLFTVWDCMSYNALVQTETCVVTVPPSGSIYLVVSGAGTSTYTISGAAWAPPVSSVLTVNPIYNPAGFTSVNITGGDVWVSFPVTSGLQYTVHWDDWFDGSGMYSGDVAITGFDNSGNILNVTSTSYVGATFGIKTSNLDVDSGYTVPTSFTAAVTGNVYLKVNPHFATGYIGLQVTSP